MFRNFVKPAAFQKVSVRERNGESENGFAHMFQISEEKDVAICKQESNGVADTRSGHSAPKDMKLLQTKCQSRGNIDTKGVYKTSIYVNGTIPNSKSSPKVPITQSQKYQQPSQVNQSDGLSHQKSDTPNQTKPPHGAHIRPDIYKRVPNISIPGERSNKSYDKHSRPEDISNHKTTTVRLSDKPQEDISSKNCDRSGHSSIKEANGDHTTTHISEAHAPEMSTNRRALYFQSKYNIVPPPPPLVESVFAGRRDIRNPASIHERQIVSVKGTVRGFKNRVRAGIATFWAQSEDKIFEHTSTEQPRPARNYRQLEHGKIIVYASSMSVVRETSERCRSVRRLLQNHMVRYEERDLYMSREIQQELHLRLANEGISVIHLPHVFADGIHIGGAEELEKLNEAGELRGLLDDYQKVIVRIMCEKCGGYRFLPCEFCHGSKKSLLRNHFTEEFCALRCMHCDENGLRRCDMCVDQQE